VTRPKHLRYRSPNRGGRLANGAIPAAEAAADRRETQAITRFCAAVLGTEHDRLAVRVAEQLGGGSLTARSLALDLGESIWKVRRCLAKLRADGVVVRTGSRCHSRWSLAQADAQ
jgi:hypothetical protein